MLLSPSHVLSRRIPFLYAFEPNRRSPSDQTIPHLVNVQSFRGERVRSTTDRRTHISVEHTLCLKSIDDSFCGEGNNIIPFSQSRSVQQLQQRRDRTTNHEMYSRWNSSSATHLYVLALTQLEQQKSLIDML